MAIETLPAADTAATLTCNGKPLALPLLTGTEGETAIDIQKLRASTGLITFDPGFGNTGACRSAITFIDGEKGILRYRGYDIADLAEKSTFLEVAWLLLRGRVSGRQWLDTIATVPLAIPGVVWAIGYLRAFGGLRVPGLGEPLTSTWLILVIVYAVRRLPYAVRGVYTALQQRSPALEEAAQSLGANRPRTFRRVTLPLMRRGLLAGGLFAFIGSAADLSSTILLVPRVELGPLSYGVYLYMQAAVGRGPGAALGVVAIVLAAVGTWAASSLARRSAAAGTRS